jgi:hypothetical protein
MPLESFFTSSKIGFPYDQTRFPGQASDEKILYITREHSIFLLMRLFFIFGIGLSIILTTVLLSRTVSLIFATNVLPSIILIMLLSFCLFILIGSWWVFVLWKKSIAIVSNKRLIKFIYTTPINRYNMSLPLDMIVDTSCHNKGFLSSYLKIGSVTARSSASSSGLATADTSRINKKYFYLENIKYFEDLQQYLNKLINTLHKEPKKLSQFRPFIPHLKGEKREEFLKNNYPEYAKKSSN